MRINGNIGGIALRIGAFVEIFTVACSPMLILGMMEGFSGFTVIIVSFAVFLLGYIVQMLSSKLMRLKREEDTQTYESNVKFVKIPYLIPSVIISVLLFVTVSRITDTYLLWYAENTLGSFYDEHTAVPMIVSSFTVPLFLIGSISWFFPTERIFSLKSVMTGTIIMFIFSAVSGLTAGSAVLLIVFAVCALYGVNQTAISKMPLGTVVSTLTRRAKLNNMAISSVVVIAIIVYSVICLILFTGITVLFTAFFAILLTQKEGGESELYEDTDVGGRVGELISENTGINSAWLITVLSVMFLVGIFGFIMFWALRNKKEIRGLLSRIKMFMLGLIEAVLFFISLSKRERQIAPTEEEVNLTFVDDEKKLQDAVINPYAIATKRVSSYKDFMSKLRKFENSDEKLMFAYVTLVEILKKKYVFIRKSDTPREIVGKLVTNSEGKDMGQITEAFETVAYSFSASENYEEATQAICRILKVNME